METLSVLYNPGMGAFLTNCVICGKPVFSGRPGQQICLDSKSCADAYRLLRSEHDDDTEDRSDHLQRMLELPRAVLERLLPKLYR